MKDQGTDQWPQVRLFRLRQCSSPPPNTTSSEGEFSGRPGSEKHLTFTLVILVNDACSWTLKSKENRETTKQVKEQGELRKHEQGRRMWITTLNHLSYRRPAGWNERSADCPSKEQQEKKGTQKKFKRWSPRGATVIIIAAQEAAVTVNYSYLNQNQALSRLILNYCSAAICNTSGRRDVILLIQVSFTQHLQIKHDEIPFQWKHSAVSRMQPDVLKQLACLCASEWLNISFCVFKTVWNGQYAPSSSPHIQYKHGCYVSLQWLKHVYPQCSTISEVQCLNQALSATTLVVRNTDETLLRDISQLDNTLQLVLWTQPLNSCLICQLHWLYANSPHS